MEHLPGAREGTPMSVEQRNNDFGVCNIQLGEASPSSDGEEDADAVTPGEREHELAVRGLRSTFSKTTPSADLWKGRRDVRMASTKTAQTQTNLFPVGGSTRSRV